MCIRDRFAESKLGIFFTNVKNWFKSNIGAKLVNLKNAWKTSSFAQLLTRVKNWFKSPIGTKLGSIKAMVANSAIGRFVGGIGKLLGKSKTLADIGNKIKNFFAMFSGGGKGVFASLKSFFSIKIPPAAMKYLKPIIDTAKTLFGPGGFMGSVGKVFGKLFFWVQIIMAAFDFVTGFTESKGNTWEAIWDGFSLAIKNFFGAFLDLGIMLEDAIKWVIKKIAGFFGFDEKEVGKAMEGISLFGPLKEAFNAIVDWIVKLMTNPLAAMEGLFGGVANVGKWIFDMALKPLWDWFKGMFPNLAAFIEPLWGMIGGLGTWIYDNALKPLWNWFKDLFDFSSFGAGLISAAKVLFLPFVALMDLVGGIWDWFMGLFGWDNMKITDDGQTVSQKLGDLLLGVWDWFLGLFGVGPGHSAEMPSSDGQTVLGTLLGLVTGVWNWFKGLFDFSTVGKAFASVLNLSLIHISEPTRPY